jgi:hypothetical protein
MKMANEDRKLAIEYLEKMKEDYIEGEGYERYPLAEWFVLDDVIKWLGQEPCEDAISRAETVQFLADHSNDLEDAIFRMAFKTASSLVNNPHNLPSVAPARKKVRDNADNKYKEVAMDLLAKYLESEQSLIAEYSGNFEESAKTLKEQTMKYLEKLGEGENAFYKFVKGLWIADYYEEESDENEDE